MISSPGTSQFDENQALNFKEGDEVELIVDEFSRKLYSKMHTAGHLLAEVVKMVFPDLEAYHGNHDPKDGYVKFKMLQEIHYDKEEIRQKVQPELAKWLQNEIGKVSVTDVSINKKEKTVTVKYCLID